MPPPLGCGLTLKHRAKLDTLDQKNAIPTYVPEVIMLRRQNIRAGNSLS